ncbi:MAG TPA: ATP-binding protein, partial [Elusimicrobiota bacterium]|nr:ATP-binding protein [Elusimicrobiota bacterium]
DDLSRGLEVQARLAGLRAAAESGGFPLRAGGSQPEARALAAACGCRATLIATDGRLAGDSELDDGALARAENHATRPEVAAAFSGSQTVAERHSVTVGRDMLYAAAPIKREGRLLGAARLSVSLKDVEAQVGRVRSLVLWTTLAALLIALSAAAALARGVARPVDEMADAARRLAAGDYGVRVRGLGDDELGVLGRTLNDLAGRVQETFGELSRDRAQLAAVLDQMEEAVVAVDETGAVLVVNPALSRLLGVGAETARGRRYVETLRHNGIARLLGAVLSDGRPAALEIRLFAPEELVFDAHAAPLLREGRVGGALLVLHDITRIRRLEQMRRDFVANVSHELRTPLSSIRGFAETLSAGAIDDKEHRLDFLKTIEEHAGRLTKLVDDLLDLSAIESGHRAPRLAPTDLAAALSAAARAFAPVAEERGVRVAIATADALPRVLADPDQLGQILANLLDNAIKYTERGGRVDLSAERWMDGVRVTVRDTGVGIPEADLPRVFERFYRVDKARAREAGGTGLGLSIVKHLVEAHGGEVSVESRQPGGASFRFTLRAS